MAIKQIMKIMKSFFVFLFLMLTVTNVISQNTDSVVVSTGPSIIYSLTHDKYIEGRKNAGRNCYFVYPLLILNNIIIREEEKVNCFRNRYERAHIKSAKLITKEEAEKKGIPNAPKDGVLFVTTKKGYYFDFSCK